MNWTANPVPKDLAEAIIQAFADRHGVSVAQILGERRNSHLVRARMDIIEHIVFDLGYSGHSVAKALRRDHTTIGHHLRKMAPRKLSPQGCQQMLADSASICHKNDSPCAGKRSTLIAGVSSLDRKDRAWRDRMFALIAERDGAHCSHCKKPYQFSWRRMGLCGGPSTGGYYNKIGKSSNLELDHKVALFVGGTNDPENLWLLCRACHRIKTNQERAGVIKVKQFEVWA